jgi:protein TonB
MKSSEYLSSSFDDIIFEGRNKAYGAYELRQLTDRHNAFGLFITMGSFATLVLLACLFASPHYTPPLPPVPVDITPSLIDLPEQTHTTHTSPPPATTQPAGTIYNPTDAAPVDITPPTTITDPVTDAPTSDIPVPYVPGPTTTTPVEPVTAPVTHVAPVVNTPVNWAPVMPSFPGGEKALREYLAKHIKMREIDIANGLSGKLLIRFYVDVDGSIKDAKVIKDGVGGYCGEESLRVVNKMPKWNPGMQNNTPVKVYYNLPIVFEVKD